MKVKIRVATEQYEFVEPEFEVPDNISNEDIITMYNDLKSVYLSQEGEGHNIREWKRVRNHFANTGEITIEDHEKCNRAQKWFIKQLQLVTGDDGESNNN